MLGNIHWYFEPKRNNRFEDLDNLFHGANFAFMFLSISNVSSFFKFHRRLMKLFYNKAEYVSNQLKIPGNR